MREGLERTGLYHSIRLPDGRVLEGAMPLAYQEERWESFGLPADLSGWRALDVGPWDGYFTFELERRGADVTAIDYADLDTFRKLHRLMGSRARYRKLDVYDASPATLGEFDVVLLLGVLYHLKHPLLALERICAITREVCIVETFVVDSADFRAGTAAPIPYAEFYETGELGGQLDNWCGPTVSQVQAWVRAAGFASATVLKVTDTTVRVRADRRWRDLPPATLPALVLHGVTSPATGGRSFDSRKEDYLSFWCAWDEPSAPPLDQVYPELDGFGIAPIFAERTATGLMVTTRLPPGLAPGAHRARLRVGGHDWSPHAPIYVDLEPLPGPLSIRGLQDAVSYQAGVVDWEQGGWLAVWVTGLSELADRANVVVYVDGVPHGPQAIDTGNGQINVALRPLFDAGEHSVTVEHLGRRSDPAHFTLQGECPPIKGIA